MTKDRDKRTGLACDRRPGPDGNADREAAQRTAAERHGWSNGTGA